MRRAGGRQLAFAFADSPQGGGRAESSGGPEGKAWLLLIANGKEAKTPATRAGGVASSRSGLWPTTEVVRLMRHQPEEPDVWTTSPVP